MLNPAIVGVGQGQGIETIATLSKCVCLDEGLAAEVLDTKYIRPPGRA